MGPMTFVILDNSWVDVSGSLVGNGVGEILETQGYVLISYSISSTTTDWGKTTIDPYVIGNNKKIKENVIGFRYKFKILS